MGKLCLDSIRFGNERVVSSKLCVKRKQVRVEKPMVFLQKRQKILLCPKGCVLQMRTAFSADASERFCNIILYDSIQKALSSSCR